jgi:hypothetical protein
MVTMSNYLSRTGTPIDAKVRAVRAWVRIQRKPTTLTIRRINPLTGTEQTPHTVIVRIERDNESDEYQNMASGENARGECIVYGVTGHPTIANTDLQRNDTFFLNGKTYTVVNMIDNTGELQFLCETQD